MTASETSTQVDDFQRVTRDVTSEVEQLSNHFDAFPMTSDIKVATTHVETEMRVSEQFSPLYDLFSISISEQRVK